MAAELIINITFNETRIALLENGLLVEFFIEKKNDKSIVGNIYKGKVARVVPGMDAAFVDIGLDKSAFLYVADVIIDTGMYEEFEETAAPVEPKERIEGVLARVSERRVPDVVYQGQRFGEIDIKLKRAGNGARDLRNLDGMSQAGAEVV